MTKEAKTPKYKIYVDANGKELRREVKGRGKNPANSTTDSNGNLIITVSNEQAKNVKPTVLQIILNADGSEKSREPKGRGRPGKGFEKREDGNWYKTETAETATVEPVTMPVATPATETATTA